MTHSLDRLKVAIVSDALIGQNSRIRMVELLHEIFPKAPIYTPQFHSDRMNVSILSTAGTDIVVPEKGHILSNIPYLRDLSHITSLESYDFSGYDIVFSISSQFSHGVITNTDTIHIGYMANLPGRFWHTRTRHALQKIMHSFLRVWDRSAADRPDFLITNSSYTRSNIHKFYRRDADIIHPYIDITKFSGITPESGKYFLYVGKLIPGRNIETLIESCNDSGTTLRIVGNGEASYVKRLTAMALPNITFHLMQSDDAVRQQYAACKALIVCHEDDFPFPPIEAQLLGKPVIAYRYGGITDIIEEGKTGMFFNSCDKETIDGTLKRFTESSFDPELCIKNAHRFRKEKCKKDIEQYITTVYESRNRS